MRAARPGGLLARRGRNEAAIASSTSRSAGSGCCCGFTRQTSATTWAKALVEAYRDRARDALRARRSDRAGAASGCARSSTRCATAPASGRGPRYRGGATATGAATPSSRTRRLLRAPAFVVAIVGTLTVGLGMFAVVYTVRPQDSDRAACRTGIRTICISSGATTGRISISTAAGSAAPTSRSCRRPAASSRTRSALLRQLGDVLAAARARTRPKSR